MVCARKQGLPPSATANGLALLAVSFTGSDKYAFFMDKGTGFHLQYHDLLRRVLPVRFSCLCFVVALFTAAAAAQEPQASAAPELLADPATFVLKVDEVELPFVVMDKHHHWITNLSQAEIRLEDNGLPPSSIRIFESQTGLPLRVGLLIDTSNSVSRQFKFEKDLAGLFVGRMLDPSKDLGFVIGFGEDAQLMQDLTADSEALAAAVTKLEVGGSTSIYDAVSYACKLLAQEPGGTLTRRVLIVLTDGFDNTSRLSAAHVIEQAVRSNVVVIVLDTGYEPDPNDPPHRTLRKLAEDTGGQILPAAKKSAMAKAFDQLTSQLRSYYLVAYHPARFSRDGSYRTIQLKTKRHGVKVLCRRGYYAARDSGKED